MHDLTTRSTRRALGSTAGALVLALVLTGCGQTTDEPAGGSAGTSAGSTPAAAAGAGTDSGTGTDSGAGSDTVMVGDPWVRATRGTDDPTMTAAFMTLDNPGTEDLALVAASSPVADAAELHEMAVVDGARVMRPVAGGIPLEAGRGKLLEPGGYHVMLLGVRQPLAPGDEVDLTLEFSDGTTQQLTVPVKAFTVEERHYHAPGTGDHDH